jgi:oligopeptide transport system substrate-binding protein
LYEAGEIDMTGVSSYSADRFLDPSEPLHNELVTGVSLCTGYVVFDVTQPPFDDVKVRQAFSMAFDRQKYIDVLLSGHALPASGLYPPGLPGFNTGLKGLPYDPARARQLLAESKYGNNLPPIVYTDAGTGSGVGADVAALAQMWKQALGVEITVENLEPDYYYERILAGQHGQIFGGGWCADYPDPQNFADVLFHTGSRQNSGNYSNPELDALLEEARVEQDVTKRIQMYQQAEQLIVDDAPVLFTTHSLSYQLVKPYVKGYVFTPIDVPIERYMWLEGK